MPRVEARIREVPVLDLQGCSHIGCALSMRASGLLANAAELLGGERAATCPSSEDTLCRECCGQEGAAICTVVTELVRVVAHEKNFVFFAPEHVKRDASQGRAGGGPDPQRRSRFPANQPEALK